MDNPDLYTKHNQYQEFEVKKYFKYYGEYLKNEFKDKEITLLDIGSGCGRVLSEVIVGTSGLKFSKVVGIDISKEMLEYSRKTYGSELISFQEMNAEGDIVNDLKNKEFDMVSSFFCLPYCKDLNAAFRNVQCFLKPNGIFCCIFTQLSKAFKESNVISKDDEHAKYMLQLRELPNSRISENYQEVLKSLLNDNGIEVIKIIDTKDDPFQFHNADAEALIEAIIPNIKHLTTIEKQVIVDKQFKSAFKPIGDKFALDLENLYIIARKLSN